MMTIFHFLFKMLKNPILKVDLNIIFLMHLFAKDVQSYKMDCV